jgi:two-component system, OmpR family, sensor histidine kinase BaeS
MRQRLLWKLLIGHIVPVFAIIAAWLWRAVERRGATYYAGLSGPAASPERHRLFLDGIHHDLILGTLALLALTLLLSYLLTRWVLRPVLEMTAVSRQVAGGNYSERVKAVSRDEVGQLVEAFNEMAENLERIESLRKNMVADISHELRTPLTNLRGYLEGLSDAVIPPTPETFRMLEQEVLRLVHLVEDLQQLARADAANSFLDRQELSLHGLLDQIMELYAPNFADKELEVQWQLEAGTEFVTADRDKLLQAIRNLADNAWKYTPRGGTLRIAVARDGDGVRTTFANDSAAIAEQDLPLLFERFFRADRSRSRDAGGAGIGLAIVRELVEAHGGRVGAANSAGTTSVWFVLPG